jgi:opacity protein-like surface antigen
MNQLRACLAMSGALLLAVLFGPLSASPVHAQEDAQRATPPPGKALLFIFRSDREPKAVQVPVAVNAVHVGELENGSFFVVPVDPGKTFLRSGDRVLTIFSFEAAADKTYFVWVEAVHGVTLVQTEMRLVSEDEGRRSLAQSRVVPLAQSGVIPLAPPSPGAAPQAPTLYVELAEPQPKPADTPTRLYVRVDIGFSQSTGADIKDKTFIPGFGIICGDASCTVPGTLKDVGSGGVLSGGVGYRFSPHVRGDLTVGYRGYKLNASDASVPPTKFKGTVTSLNAMASGYYDFATTGWTPYLGIGLGLSQNKIGTVTFDDGAGFNGTLAGGTKAGVAAAFMAGAGIPLSDRLTLDVGYRYISLGALEIPAGGGYGGASGKLNAHELTVGVRF